MKNRIVIIIGCVLFASLFLGFLAAEMVMPDRYFSQNENRILASKPEPGVKNLLQGTYAKEYETYVTDQFLARDSWIQLKNYGELMLQKKELNGVYMAKDNSLIEKHGILQIDSQKAEAKADKLAARTAEYEQLVGSGHVKAMLVPTADIILADRLPPYTEEYDQSAYLRRMQGKLPAPEMLIPVEEALKQHGKEAIYYKTDHHWTSLGAYYAYLEWARAAGEEPVTDWTARQVTDDFLGTLHSKVNINVPADSIEIYENTDTASCRVEYVYEEKTADSFYDWEKLQTKDQYAVFFGGNYPLISIQTAAQNQKTLLVIKDSYANCFVPFLAGHYRTIYMLDPRYYRDDVKKVIEERRITDVLVLYDVIHFIENY